jgi:hypothetical protein
MRILMGLFLLFLLFTHCKKNNQKAEFFGESYLVNLIDSLRLLAPEKIEHVEIAYNDINIDHLINYLDLRPSIVLKPVNFRSLKCMANCLGVFPSNTTLYEEFKDFSGLVNFDAATIFFSA